jgi:Protein of unknown function (DUF3551)
MRKSLLGFLAAVSTMTAAMTTASAQYYPWCLVDDLKSGAMSCYFTTREQCMMSTGGNVGHCVANPASPGPRKTRR